MAEPAGWAQFYRVVKRIPRGRVATYGQVALAAGKPGAARQVGYAMAALRGTRHAVPWQRVLGARPRGRAGISLLDPMGAAVQRALLEAEGVGFDAQGRVELAEFGWRGPRGAAGRATPPPAPAAPSRSRSRTRGSSGRTRTSRRAPR
ncbi:MGMT family protein [Anaeromyxobacter dehalogenans]|uniref:Methylated-DNA-(Protein)-cysteine S-methyltransferase n=1 Tax=Anaeromyxobacter dehalogenans (strain 2CP-C) TaxID=290397 RepID=Q2IPB1_ANADE|nr:MGMT family protein [Anaeromyxobacter dehalogenans]ABC80640.1 Methylated-DNA-(protein)-cysteine S-methyltransferase [Anaeromyxobacter dehalogenans 2CP-C]